MKHVSPRFICGMIVLALTSPLTVGRDVIANQPPGPGPARPSMVNTSIPAAEMQFDDFTISQTTSLTNLTAYGVEQGDSSQNVDVACFIYAGVAPPGNGPALSQLLLTRTGVQSGGNLVFDMGGTVFGPGIYWLGVAVSRPGTGGQWLWSTTGSVHGSESYSAVSSLAGTSLRPGSQVYGTPADMAFTLTGIIPAPGAGATAVFFAALHSRRTRQAH